MHQYKNNSSANVYHLEQMVDNFFPYSQKQLGFDKPATIVFHSDEQNANTMLGKTAFYDPESYEVYLFVDKRHPKDILRSLSHELVHHAQNCRGDLDNAGDAGPGYAQKDPHMRKMEREAYTKGNLIFRDFEDLIKTGKINIEIDFSDSGEPKMSLKEWKNNEINTKLMKKWGFLKESKEEVVESDESEPLAEDSEGEETYHYAEDEGADHKREGRLEAHLDAIEHHLHSLRDDMAYDEDHERRHEKGTHFREGQEGAPKHYCVHHGGVQHEGKIHMAEAVSHNYDKELGRVTHYDMKLEDGTLLEAVAAEDIQVTDASLAEQHKHRVEDDEGDVKEEVMGRGRDYKGIAGRRSANERGNRPSDARKMSLKKESEKADTPEKQKAVTHPAVRAVKVSGKEQKAKTHPSLPAVSGGKISVREAKELTRRIIERIKKENK